VQGSLIIQIEKKDSEETINSTQSIELPFLIDPCSMNLGEKSCTINSFDQPPFSGCHQSHISVCCDECLSTSYDLFPSHEHFKLDLECTLVEVDIHIEASYAPHFPVCPSIHNTSTCIRDTLHSIASSSYMLSQSTQGNEVVDDENSVNT